jgi:signal transduction histidine kinase/ligand-binding sensor domain-containing protein/DNA-binding response OmpR family regulator
MVLKMEETRKNNCHERFWFVRLKCASQLIVFSRALFIAFISCCSGIHLYAQELSPTFHAVAPDVLSSSFVRCFYKDSKGYMWIGTEDALIRYDASKARRYTHSPNDKSSLPHNTVNTITEGKDEQLWVGTAQGLCIYDRERDLFINVDSIQTNKNYLNNRYITDLEFDAEGRLWIGTHEGGINIYDQSKGEFIYIIDKPQDGILPSSNFINILVNIGDTMWCASKGGLLLYNTRTRERLPLNSLDRFSNAQISSIVQEKSGSLLIATVLGEITRVVPGKTGYTFEKILAGNELGETSNRILSMALDQKGNIFAGGENSGFNAIEPRTHKVTRFLEEENNAMRLPTNSIQSIYADDRGLIWVGTFNNGVFLLNSKSKKFATTETVNGDLSLANSEVSSFAEDTKGNIWMALYGRGVARMNLKTNIVQSVDQINQKISSRNITSIIFDRQGELWLGTAGKGVFRVDPETNQLANYSLTSKGFGNDQVFCLYEDRNGTVWAGTWGSGLFFYDKTSNEFVSAIDYNQPGHIPNTAYVTDMVEDSEGTFWVGTLYGLYELKRTSPNSFAYQIHLPGETEGSILGSQVQTIVEDSNKDLWVGTTDGLNLKIKGSSDFIVCELGKMGHVNQIRSVLTDRRGNIWMGGSNGLLKFDPNTKTLINYSREDGLRSNSFRRKAALASSIGKLFFGSDNGFDSFYPDSIQVSSQPGALVLTDLRINNESVRPGAGSPLKKHISQTSRVVLSYDQRSFVIDFSNLDYSPSSNYQYCYKLEGFDDDWNCIGPNHTATYTNIDPGDYVFLVKAASSDGVWTNEPVRLDIRIKQVFWKTWWAWAIYVATLTMMIYALMKIRIERIKLKNEILFEKLKLEEQERLSESKTQFFTNVAHEFRTPLSLILIPLESLMGANDVPMLLRERIYTAFKNASRMKRLVNELLDFNKLEAGNLQLNIQHGELIHFIMETSYAFKEMAAKRRIDFSVTFENPCIAGWFDRDKLERVIFNVLSNAFKFTADEGAIKVRISTQHFVISNGTLSKCLQLVIEDNGIGILPEELPHIFEKFYQAKSSFKSSSPGTGIGLSLTKALVELHNGTITVESVPDRATIFTIVLPIGANAYDVDENSEVPAEVVPLRTDHEQFLTPASENNGNGETESGSKPTILVVEDNPELRAYLVAELRIEFSIVEARDGEEGMAVALEKNPDLIISDVMMPVKDGIEFCDAVKTNINTSHVPFIMLTAKATVEDQINGIKTGADLYISKPFNIRHLMAHVHQIISSRQKLYSKFSQDVYLMPGKATSNALDQEFLQKAIDYVIANLQDSQLSVDSIASIFNLGRMQVYRKIKALTGKSVVEFIRMVRMKQAIKLMDSHKLTLSEIAFEVGFNSASYFTRTFKDEYGKTPSEYLEQK